MLNTWTRVHMHSHSHERAHCLKHQRWSDGYVLTQVNRHVFLSIHDISHAGGIKRARCKAVWLSRLHNLTTQQSSIIAHDCEKRTTNFLKMALYTSSLKWHTVNCIHSICAAHLVRSIYIPPEYIQTEQDKHRPNSQSPQAQMSCI